MNNYYSLTYLSKRQIKENIDNNFIKIKAITNNKCYRCGNINVKDKCNNCSEFGILTINDYLYKYNQDIRPNEYKKVEKELIFTSLQKECSQFLISAYYNNKDSLVHAVCGAGKTEITFPVIEEVLKQRKYIAFAITRIDILYDVKERLEWYFPNVSIGILNSKEGIPNNAQIFIMTTNQLLKFKDAFSLVIIDEVDAFPYEYNEKFDYGAKASLIEKGIIIYLTSTPSKMLINKQLNTFIINRRWHGYDLAVPKFIYMDKKKFNNNKIPILMYYFIIKFLKTKRQQLWFISNIKELYIVNELLSKKFKNITFDIVYADSDDRRKNIENFSKGNINILITTTILERGVTFKDIDTIIIDTSSNLYNKAALIQIAGRVRRKKEYQLGNIYFLHNGVTEIMLESKKEIRKMNNKK